MPNREALSVLDEYETQGLDKELFRRKLHHLGGSFETFYKYAKGLGSFRPLECNQLLLDRLKFIFDQIKSGASSDPSSLEELIERSFDEIPCTRYPGCQGHKFDRRCKHGK